MAMGCAIISLEDCIAICGLEAIEVQAIAEHEHIPEISAAALALSASSGWWGEAHPQNDPRRYTDRG
jgi:hypothetical protein